MKPRKDDLELSLERCTQLEDQERAHWRSLWLQELEDQQKRLGERWTELEELVPTHESAVQVYRGLS